MEDNDKDLYQFCERNHYKLGKEISHGSFGKVYEALDE